MLSSAGVVRTAVRSMGRRAPKQGKPPILPPSKKVLYHVVHTPWQKPQDVEELLWRRLAYNNAVVSLKELFKAEAKAKEASGSGVEHMREEEEREFDKLLAEAERRNEERKAARAEKEAEQWTETRKEILAEIEEGLAERKIVADKSAAKVRDAIARSATFVTRENLEESILKALDNPVVYDFAIDMNGTKYIEEAPVKYQEGTPTRQKGRLYERTLAPLTVPSKNPEPEPESLKANAS